MSRRRVIAVLLALGALLILSGQSGGRVPFVTHPGALIAVVEETSQRDAALSKALGDAAYWDGLRQRGLRWKLYDVNTPDAPEIVAAGKQAGIPAVVVADQAGAVLAAQKLEVRTTAEIDRVVRRATGL